MHKTFLSLFLGIIFFCGHSFNLMALDLTKGHSEKIKLGKHLDILEDKLGELSFDDILKGNHKEKFIRAKTDFPNKRFTKSAFWLRFKLSQKQVPLPSYFLVFSFAGTDYVTLYKNIEGQWIKEEAGDQKTFSEKKTPHHFFSFPLKPGKDSTYYIRVKNSAAMQLPLVLYTPKAYHQNIVEESITNALVVGILLIMTIYYIVIYFSTRMVQYLPYSIYIVGLIGLILSHSGFGGQYLTPNSTFLNNEGIIVSVGIMLIGLSHFIYRFIELEKAAPKMAKSFYIALGFGVFNIIGPLFIPYYYAIRLLIATVTPALGIIVFWGIYAYVKKLPNSRYLAFAFSSLLIGAFFKLFEGIGFLPSIFVFTQGLWVGVIIQLVLFALGLSNLIKTLKEAAEENARQLGDFNKNLTHIVDLRTEELASSLEKTEILLDNMGQAVFAIDKEHHIVPPVSKFATNIFGDDIQGKTIWETLFRDTDPTDVGRSFFEFGISITFGADYVQWLLVKDDFPKKVFIVKDGEKRSLKLSMSPIYNKDELLEKIVFIVEDVTEIEKLEAEVEKEKAKNMEKVERLQMIVSNDKANLRTFFSEAYPLLSVLEDPYVEKEEFLRAAHTLKGLSRLYGLNFLSTIIHRYESAFFIEEGKTEKRDFREIADEETPLLKIAINEALQLVTEVYGEVYNINDGTGDEAQDEVLEISQSRLDNAVKDVSSNLENKNYSVIVSILEKLKAINIKKMIQGLKGIVLNTANGLGKEVRLNVYGEDIYLEKEKISLLKEAFIHLLTNSVDHGIERSGEIQVSLSEGKEGIDIHIEDDGAGIDIERVRKKIELKGLATGESIENMMPGEIAAYIFHPEFSTKENVSETSGRGVGMNVVKENIERMEGQIKIEDNRDKGTGFLIHFPSSISSSNADKAS